MSYLYVPNSFPCRAGVQPLDKTRDLGLAKRILQSYNYYSLARKVSVFQPVKQLEHNSDSAVLRPWTNATRKCGLESEITVQLLSFGVDLRLEAWLPASPAAPAYPLNRPLDFSANFHLGDVICTGAFPGSHPSIFQAFIRYRLGRIGRLTQTYTSDDPAGSWSFSRVPH